jgi:hypothetical protein
MVEFNNLQTKHLIVASTCVAAGIWYFIRNRGKSFRQVHVSEEFHQSQFSEWLSRTFSTSKLMGSEHPEGPNLGFKSNNSWFSGNGESTAKIDLLHQGHTKGVLKIFNSLNVVDYYNSITSLFIMYYYNLYYRRKANHSSCWFAWSWKNIYCT